MANYISEAHIEEADIQLFKDLEYEFINADGKQLLRRESLKEVVLKDRLRASLSRLNPHLTTICIEEAIGVLTQPLTPSNYPVLVNKEIYGYIKNSIKVEYRKGRKKETAYVKVIDFNTPENNDFLVVQQLSIEYQRLENITRRPDLLLYVNGLPLVYIELKNAVVNIKKGYDVNLQKYTNDIPQLFYYNLFVCISNGIKTRVGSFNADWEHFFPWARLKDSAEGVPQKSLLEIEDQGAKEQNKLSLQYFTQGLCQKKNLIDYLENFVLYHKNKVKIIAKNHQYLGVNNAFKSFKNREGKDGKIGIFWQTQGSGKSYSMIFFAKKVHRKIGQNFSFLVVTDRSDLDAQIFRNFTETEVIKLQTGDSASKRQQKAAESFYRPSTRAKLLAYLKTQRKYVFAMIFKFGLKKGKQMSAVSDRKDWVVIIDEAHRTQYKGLADNMRIALPNAQYMAFTGTPIFKNKLTKNWFGDCISKYDFLQAIEDGATVPLFYKRGVPRVKQVNEELTDEVDELFNSENLTEEQIRKLEDEYATILEVVKRDDRLEEVAKHIVNHFPYRLDVRDEEGNRRPMKAMVISIDKFTAVRMFDKVQRLKKEKIKELIGLTYDTKDPEEKERYRNARKFLEETKMAVVISEEAKEEKKFEKEGLQIKEHRRLMDVPDANGQNIEDYFKDPDNVYRIVFVTSMWLTGFDAPSVSTLYLDKPMKMHTLMQAIARCNRVFEGKKNGLVVDYFGVFRNLKKAFSIYIETKKGEDGEEEEQYPAQVFSELLKLIEAAIAEGMAYCKEQGVDLQAVLDIGEKGFKEIGLFHDYENILLAKDKIKKQFNLYTHTITSLYDSARPEIYDYPTIKHTKEVFEYLQKLVNRSQNKAALEEAREQMTDLLDKSVRSQGDLLEEPEVSYSIKEYDRFDLSKFDIEKLKEEFKERKHKHIVFTDLRELLEHNLSKMLRGNRTYVHFVIRYERIIDSYNSDSISLQEALEGLGKIVEEMTKAEEERVSMGMTPEQKEIFDLLKKDSLTKEEKKRVEKAAVELFEYLDGEKGRVLVVDWHKSKQTRNIVKSAIVGVLSEHLPESYGRAEFTEKTDVVFQRFYERAEDGGARNEAA